MISLQEDRNWLENQLKSTKKQNKLLRAELEIRIEKASGTSAITGELSAPSLISMSLGVDEDEKRGSFPSINNDPPPRSATSMSGNKVKIISPKGYSPSGRHTAPGHRPGSQSGDAGDKVAASSNGNESVLIKQKNKEIQALRASLASERKAIQALRASVVTSESRKNDLEEFFIKCVDDVRQDIVKRRSNLSSRSSSRNHQEVVKEGIQSLSLGEFTSADRKKVMDKVFSNEEVLQFVYNSMFSSNEAPLGRRGPAEGDGPSTPAIGGSDPDAFVMSDNAAEL